MSELIGINLGRSTRVKEGLFVIWTILDVRYVYLVIPILRIHYHLSFIYRCQILNFQLLILNLVHNNGRIIRDNLRNGLLKTSFSYYLH